jgi:RNA polymerase sigma-70 factor, ECF subfamily
LQVNPISPDGKGWWTRSGAEATGGRVPPVGWVRRVCIVGRGTAGCRGEGRRVAITSGTFEDFYVQTVDRVVGQLYVATGDLHEAEEVVQEAFVRAASRWARLERYDLPEAWVRRVAMNLARDRARWRRRRTVLLRRIGEPPQVPAASVEALALADALRELPIRHRQAIVLHYLVDMPVEEVARTLLVPVGTVKSWLARGRRALAGALGERERTWSS